MKCEICKKETNWDSSVGYEYFIVCNNCHNALGDYSIDKCVQAMEFIFKCGELRRKAYDERNARIMQMQKGKKK